MADNINSKLKDVIDVKDFGAKGDGLHDDSEAFNNAIAYARSRDDVSFFIPKGMYRMMPSPWWLRLWQWLRRKKRLRF